MTTANAQSITACGSGDAPGAYPNFACSVSGSAPCATSPGSLLCDLSSLPCDTPTTSAERAALWATHRNGGVTAWGQCRVSGTPVPFCCRVYDPSSQLTVVKLIGTAHADEPIAFTDLLSDLGLSGSSMTAIAQGKGGDDIINGSNTVHKFYAESLYGNQGADHIVGGAGNDRIFGGNGNDDLRGGPDQDEIHGENGNDEIWGDSPPAFNEPGGSDDILFGGDGNDEMHGGAGKDQLLGEDGNDILEGDEGADQLHGGDGDDDLFGEDLDEVITTAGEDALYGGKGNDTLFGGPGDDTLCDSDFVAFGPVCQSYHMVGGDGVDKAYIHSSLPVCHIISPVGGNGTIELARHAAWNWAAALDGMVGVEESDNTAFAECSALHTLGGF